MLLCFVPESPYFLAQKDKADLAHKSIRWLMVEESLIETTSLDVSQFLRKNPPPVKLEQLEEEQNNFVTKEEEQSSSSKEEQDPSTCFKIFLMCSIMVLSRLCGVTQYSYYMLDIVEHAGSMGVAKDQNSVDFSTWASAGISVFEMIGKRPFEKLVVFAIRNLFAMPFQDPCYASIFATKLDVGFCS